MNHLESVALSRLRLLLLDFDGVLTDNRVLVDQDGREAVFVNRSDGLAINEFRKAGISIIIISTERNEVVRRRAEKLQIEVQYGVENKKEVAIGLCEKLGILPDETAFIGNDLNDLCVLNVVGLPACPSDACSEVQKASKFVLGSRGGFGVVRAFLSLYLEAISEAAP